MIKPNRVKPRPAPALSAVSSPVPLWSWPRIWGVCIGASVLYAVLSATAGYIGFTLAGETAGGTTMPPSQPEWWRLFARTLPSWGWNGLIAPWAVLLARQFPLAPGFHRRNFGIHLVGALLYAALFVLGASALRYGLFVQPVSDTAFRAVLFRYHAMYFNLFFLFYWSLVGVHSAVRHFREAEVRSMERMELEAVATKARLDALRRQLHPHFLFNLLNAISSVVLEGDRRRAVEALSDLTQLLRVSFSRDDPFIPLREELRFLEMYVELHRLRLEDRVVIDYRIEPGAAEASVPTFLLQPLVENAIEHGLVRGPQGGAVVVAARALAKTLEISVSNPLPATPARPRGQSRRIRREGGGVGLANTRERVARSYGGRGTFEFSMGANEAVARLTLPLAAAPSQLTGPP